ncbi:YwhD family protein [Paenibacillus sp. YYML68]|uniref:YwhD family protein n=1 Tax=Paenibacillus sp. YYML68 TaxID=2909250 RepID=UPI002491FD32|nr:YwhD family protein [Paenibacillus sp. YYML68]
MESNNNQQGQPAAASEKKLPSLNIVSSKETKHRGFGQGSIDLSQLSSVIIDGDEAYLDLGALHAKSRVEKGIKFVPNKEDAPGGRTCWIVWVAVDFKEEGKYYAGVTSCEMTVDPDNRRGWKLLADHVNRMDHALKRRILLDNIGEHEKQLLKQFLIDNDPGMWERSGDDLKAALS